MERGVKYLLDSNTAVDIMRRPHGAAADRFLATAPSDMVISIVVKAELLVGPNRQKSLPIELPKVERFLSRVTILPFDDACAVEFGRIAAILLDAGTPVGGIDVQIAATARCHGLIVVTRNSRDFGKVPGLIIENWIV
jgi:tRNA(fMet)-specific endonuclease VapC